MKLIFTLQVHDDLTFQFIGTRFWTDTFLVPTDLLQYKPDVFDFVKPDILGIYSQQEGTYDVTVNVEVQYSYTPPPNETIILSDKKFELESITKVA